jgi:hypothetical protein
MDEHIDDLEEPRRLPKWVIRGMAVIMVLFMISLIFFGWPIGDILIGQLESTGIEGNVIEVEGIRIELSDSAASDLKASYFTDLRTEFSACLKGKVKGNVYSVDSLYIPKMYEQTFNHVRFESCSKDTIVMLHSHPYKSCVASETDLNTLASTKLVNSEVIMVIMCEPERVSVYR